MNDCVLTYKDCINNLIMSKYELVVFNTAYSIIILVENNKSLHVVENKKNLLIFHNDLKESIHICKEIKDSDLLYLEEIYDLLKPILDRETKIKKILDDI